MHIVIWKYKVKPGKDLEFERLYGPDGDWVKWFKESSNYQSTELVKSNSSDLEYVTIDRWDSEEAYDQFYQNGKDRFEEIDGIGDSLTEEETLLGSFTET